MIKIVTLLEELRELLVKPIKETIQSLVDSFEDMQKVVDKLSDIAEEKETYLFCFNIIKFKLRKSKYKRLWKKQKIP